ncbi:MAG: TetR/AcrR family transcriptional regulator [Candidatus Marinimicrobia bacterium]|nr:TetR/AcrR family transcriptional regulator [Candidatus Neomarinimicrobiota bacterium]
MTIAERKAREKKRKRNTILEAAEKLFAKEGYHTTTMDNVAEATDFSKGTIYLYFKNKDDLFFTILDERLDTHIRELKERLSKTIDLKETIVELVTEQLTFFEKHHYFFRLTIAEQCKIEKTPGSDLRQHFLKKQMTFLMMIEEALSSRMSAGKQYPFSARSLALCLMGSTHAHMMNWLMSRGQQDLQKSRDEIIQLILNRIEV